MLCLFKAFEIVASLFDTISITDFWHMQALILLSTMAHDARESRSRLAEWVPKHPRN